MMWNQCKMCTLCSPILLGVGTRKRLSEEIKLILTLSSRANTNYSGCKPSKNRLKPCVCASRPSVDVLCGLQRKTVGVEDLKASFNVYNWWRAGVSRARMWCVAYFFCRATPKFPSHVDTSSVISCTWWCATTPRLMYLLLCCLFPVNPWLIPWEKCELGFELISAPVPRLKNTQTSKTPVFKSLLSAKCISCIKSKSTCSSENQNNYLIIKYWCIPVYAAFYCWSWSSSLNYFK